MQPGSTALGALRQDGFPTSAHKFARIAIAPDMHLSSAGLAELGDLSTQPVLRLKSIDPKDCIESICRGIDALVSAWQSELSAELLSRFPALRMIALRATSTRKVDLEYARTRRIAVTNIEGYGDTGTAEFVVQNLLRIVREIPAHLGELPGELRGKTLGLVGFGSVAQLVAQVANSFGMQVRYNVPDPEAKSRPLSATYRPLHDLLSESDFVSFHSPAFRRVVTRTDLEHIRPGVGVIVTTLGLPFALEEFTAWIRQSGSPTAFDLCAAHECAQELRRHPSVSVWDSYSARTVESVVRAESMVIRNLRRFLTGPYNYRRLTSNSDAAPAPSQL